MSLRRLPLLLLPLGAFAPACTGDISQFPAGSETSNPPGRQPSNGTNTGNNGTVTTPTGVVQPPAMTMDPGTSPAACGTGTVSRLMPTRLWRLSPQQYVNTVSALFKVDVPLATVTGDGKSDAVQQPRGFDSDALTNKVYDALGESYKDNAKRVATEVMGKLPTTQACIKEANAAAGCIEGFVKAYAEPAFRRPLAAAELTRFADFYKANAAKHSPADAGRMVLEAVLQSPHFVYRTELGVAGSAADKPVKLTHHELAAQLTYLIADLPPSAVPEVALAAQEGKMDQPAVVKTLAEKLVRTPQARAKIKNFFAYYIPYYRDFLDGNPTELKDATKFPSFAALKKSMEAETTTFLNKVLETKPSLKTIFTADYSFLNAELATHYGMTAGPKGTELVESKVQNRMGLLGHAGVIAALSQFDTTSPVHRGLFYYQTLLCNDPGVPDPNATSMVERLRNPTDPKATERQKYEYFVKNEQGVCIACHQLFQPMGLGLEMFDPIGRYRTTENGRNLDFSVELLAGVAGQEVAGKYPDSLKAMEAILTSTKGRECFVSKYASYAFGMDAQEQGDTCAVKRVAERFGAADTDIAQLLVALTQESSFFFRQLAK